MRTRYLIAVVVALALGVAALGASRGIPVKPIRAGSLLTATPPDPPTPLQRAEVENDMKQLQLDQAQVQILNLQFDQTKTALAQKLKVLERAGWDLNLNTWTYEPKGAAK
jgi:hypothetical protein